MCDRSPFRKWRKSMTKDDDFIDYEVQSEDRPYYLDIDGKRIYVTEEVYRAYKQPLWAEHKRKEREGRCQVSNGRGGLKRCNDDCRECPSSKNGSTLSLDRMYEDYELEIPDSGQSILEALVKEELKQRMVEAVNELGPIDQYIIRSFMNELSEREIAKETGLSQKAINKRKNKLFKELREKLEKYR